MKNDGGAAFPRPAFAPDGVTCEDCEINDSSEGMSLRDWFAGQALSSLLSCETFQSQLAMALNEAKRPANQEQSETARVMAKRSYIIADAMLAERDKP